jgi:hypothetical protein
MMRVAFDCQISRAAVEATEDAGFQVVYWAGSEHDELWVAEALDLGADVFMSPDYDIEILANRYDREFIRLPQGLGGRRLVDFVTRKLRECKRIYEVDGGSG